MRDKNQDHHCLKCGLLLPGIRNAPQDLACKCNSLARSYIDNHHKIHGRGPSVFSEEAMRAVVDSVVAEERDRENDPLCAINRILEEQLEEKNRMYLEACEEIKHLRRRLKIAFQSGN